MKEASCRTVRYTSRHPGRLNGFKVFGYSVRSDPLRCDIFGIALASRINLRVLLAQNVVEGKGRST